MVHQAGNRRQPRARALVVLLAIVVLLVMTLWLLFLANPKPVDAPLDDIPATVSVGGTGAASGPIAPSPDAEWDVQTGTWKLKSGGWGVKTGSWKASGGR